MNRRWHKRCAALLTPLFCALLLAGCAGTKGESDPAKVLTTTAPLSDEVADTTAAAQTDEENRDLQIDTYVILNDDATTIKGDGASYADGRLTVSGAGVYSIKGTLTDGQIYVDSNDDGKVKLYLEGVEIYCADSAPVYVAQSPKETQLILAKGSENKLRDNAARTMTDAQAEDKAFATAAVYSMDDLQIEGEGALTIEANFGKGVFSRDALQIKGGALTVTAADDAIRGKDRVEIAGGTLKLQSGGDGIRTTNEEKGDISVSGGDITVVSAQDCIQAVGDISVSGGTLRLQSGGGYQEALQTQESGSGFFGGFGKDNRTDTADDSGVSAKGIKADGNIALSGGAFLLDCLDDALHAGANLAVSGGSFRIRTNDDGVHAEESIAIAGGAFEIDASYEGVEGNVISISGGTFDITAQDDGLNAASPGDQNDMAFFRSLPDDLQMPTDDSGNPQPPDNNGNPPSFPDGQPPAPDGDMDESRGGFGFRRQGGMEQADESCVITISGGTIRVNASGDGIDSNGNITVSGGTILVLGPTNNGNGALDYTGSCVVTGGTLCAVGSAGMAQGVSVGSIASLTASGSFSAGDTLTITDAQGSEIYALKLEKQAAHLVLASETLQSGAQYTLQVNGSAQGAYTAQ